MLTSRTSSSTSFGGSLFSRIRMLPSSPSFANATARGAGSKYASTLNSPLKVAMGIALALLLLTAFVWTVARSSTTPAIARSHTLLAAADEIDSSLSELSSLPPAPAHLRDLSHLVLVAGHSVLTSLDVHSLSTPSNWALLDYQKDQLPTFIHHIRRGVQAAREDPNALLVFSGGQSRAHAGPRSEAQSYWMAAELEHWWKEPTSAATTDSADAIPFATQSVVDPTTTADPTAAVAPTAAPLELPLSPASQVDSVSLRATTEEYARDSFENLLFGLCRFHEMTGHYPHRVTLVGFEFKRARFVYLHRAAVRFPLDRFDYLGIDPPKPLTGDIAAAKRWERTIKAERELSFRPFEEDPYGCAIESSTTPADFTSEPASTATAGDRTPSSVAVGTLLAKRLSRNPFRRQNAYEQSCPELRHLLRYCGRTIFAGPLPWDQPQQLSHTVATSSAAAPTHPVGHTEP